MTIALSLGSLAIWWYTSRLFIRFLDHYEQNSWLFLGLYLVWLISGSIAVIGAFYIIFKET